MVRKKNLWIEYKMWTTAWVLMEAEKKWEYEEKGPEVPKKQLRIMCERLRKKVNCDNSEYNTNIHISFEDRSAVSMRPQGKKNL